MWGSLLQLLGRCKKKKTLTAQAVERKVDKTAKAEKEVRERWLTKGECLRVWEYSCECEASKLRSTEMLKAHEMTCSCITCGTEGDECQGVFADRHHIVFGKGKPAYDVLYEIIWNDWGHVPLQFSQHHQFPVLKERHHENLLSLRVKWHGAKPPWTMTRFSVFQRKCFL